MKKILSIFLVIACVVSVVGCSKYDPINYLSKESGVDFTQGTIEINKDDHDNFHGDGYTYISEIFTNDNLVKNIESNVLWKKLPVSENLQPFVEQSYGDEKIPKTTNGYYFFYDRSPESKDMYDDSDLNKRYSYNFIFAIYDTDTNKLYYVDYLS